MTVGDTQSVVADPYDSDLENVQSVRSRLVDTALVTCSLCAPPAVAASMLRAAEVGWHNIMALHVGAAFVLWATTVFRRRLTFCARVVVLLGVLYLLGTGGLLAWGLVGAAPVILIAFCVLATTFLGTRAGILALAATLMAVAVLGAGVSSGAISLGFDSNEYATAPSSWLLLAVVIGMFDGVIALAVGRLHSSLVATIRSLCNRARELQYANERLLDEISQRKRATQTLRESTEEYRSIFEHSPEMIVLMDAQGVVVGTNHKAEELLNCRREDFLGMHFAQLPFWSEEKKALLTDLFHRRLHGGQISPYELDFMRPDGTTMICRVDGTTIADSEGAIARILLMMSDVTEQRRAENALLEEKNRAQNYLDIVSVILVAIDAQQKVTLINRKGCEVLKWSEAEILGDNWFDTVIPVDERESVKEVFSQLIAGQVQPAEYFENRVITKDGQERLIAWHNTIVKDASGGTVGTLSSGQDVTYRKEAEEKLRRMEAQLAHVSRLSTMGEMMAGIAHELNQPLNSIVNFSKACRNVLAAETDVDLDAVREWNDDIAAAARRASAIVDRLRGFSRRTEWLHAPANLNEIVEESLNLTSADAREFRVAVTAEFASPSARVVVDRIQIQQVLVNLLRNAFEAMNDDRIDLRHATVRTEPAGEAVEVSVTDSGFGLPAEDELRIFEAFVTTKPDGLGMGLAISTTIAESHGGRLWATANPDRGATFHFTLPVVKEDPHDAE